MTEDKKKDVDELITECKQKWGKEDERTINFEKLLPDWIVGLDENNHHIFIELLRRFDYYPHDMVITILKKLYNHLITTNEINIENTIYTSIESKSGIVNSSDEYITEFKYCNGINHYMVYDNIWKISDTEWHEISNVVFIDDCSGSGKTFIDYLTVNKGKFIDKSVFLIIIHIMEDALKMINDFSQVSKICIEVIYGNKSAKALDNKIYDFSSEKVKEIVNYESKKVGIPKKEIFGFQNSESLLAFYNNTPNNTLGVFRYNTSNNKAVFPRINDVEPDRFRRNKKIENYNIKIRSSSNG